MPNHLHTLALTFDLPLRHSELYAFRGAMAALAGREQDVFHNHDNAPVPAGRSLRSGSAPAYKHRYPLIQYRVHDGHAAIFACNDGVKALEDLRLSGRLADFRLNGRRKPLRVRNRLRERRFELDVLPKERTHRYRIYKYIPFSPESYRIYKTTFGLRDKVVQLEHLLQNHIVSFGRSVGWEMSPARRLKVTVNDIDRVKKVNALGHDLMAFDLVFSVNAVLPEGLGLGRKTAFGFGWIIPIR